MEQKSILKALSFVAPYGVCNKQKIRIGASADGGYVMLDDFPVDTIAYSLGIGGDVSWDLDLANRGLKVFQYDHTISDLPSAHSNFHFNRVGIGTADLDSIKTLQTIVKENRHENSKTIIKMDIEDAEWDVLTELHEDLLGQCSQLVIEFHGLARLADHKWHHRIESVFRKLFSTHFAFHVHANNWGEYVVVNGVPFPDVLEVSYANRKMYAATTCCDHFPTNLDAPNEPGKDDYFLGQFRFLYIPM
ncbi:MAG: hypothetical protein ACKOC0_13055 [Cytophagales bacterium]